jgi:hypothetical protein
MGSVTDARTLVRDLLKYKLGGSPLVIWQSFFLRGGEKRGGGGKRVCLLSYS